MRDFKQLNTLNSYRINDAKLSYSNSLVLKSLIEFSITNWWFYYNKRLIKIDRTKYIKCCITKDNLIYEIHNNKAKQSSSIKTTITNVGPNLL